MKTSTLVMVILALALVAIIGARAGADRREAFDKKCVEMGGRVEGDLCLAPNGDVMIRNS